MNAVDVLKKNRRENVIPKMFFSAAAAMIFTLFVGMAAQFVDGIITSRFLGNDAYSGIVLFGPMNLIFLMFASFLATGNQIIFSGFLGQGKRDEANHVFSFCLVAGLLVSGLIILVCILIPDPLLAFCGVTKAGKPELYGHMLSYLRGYLFGIPALILVQVMGPIVVMDNGNRYFIVSAVVMCVTDIAGDLVNALVLHGGTFGMGIATSVALTVQLVMMTAFLLRKKGLFRFSLSVFRPREYAELTKAGLPSMVQSFAVTLRDLGINRLNLLFAVSTVAIVARGIQYEFNMLIFCIGVGIGNAMVSIAGIYHSVSDREGLTSVFTYGMRLSLCFALGTAFAVFLLAPRIAGFYTADQQTAALSAFGIRCMAVSQLADIVICVYISFLQSVHRHRTVILLNILDRFILPVGSAALLVVLFGSKGLLASIALGKALLAAVVFLTICIINRKVPRTIQQYMLMPEDFGGTSQDNLYGSVTSYQDVAREQQRIEEFCLRNGAGVKAARRMALFMEEMANNIVKHGNPDARKMSGAEYRLFISEGRICLTLRDYNRAFDPTMWYRDNRNNDPGEGLGIRMVMVLADDIRYFNAFNSNNLILWLNLQDAAH